MTYQEFSAICKRTRYENKDRINKCVACPAYVHISPKATRGACYFAAMQVVKKCGDIKVDDGSVSDEDLPYWFN